LLSFFCHFSALVLSFRDADGSVPVKLLACHWHCSPHALQCILLDVGVHLIQVQLVLVLSFLNGLHNLLGTAQVLNHYTVEFLVKVELHVAHLEVVASDLERPREKALRWLHCPDAQPLTSPVGVQLVVLTADLYLLIPLTRLGHLEESLAFAVAIVYVEAYLADQLVSQLGGGHLERLLRHYFCFEGEGVELEGELEHRVEVAKVGGLLARVAIFGHDGRLSVWEGDVLPVRLEPFSEGLEDVGVLIDVFFSSDYSRDVGEHVLNLS